jgi:hypothetical protein
MASRVVQVRAEDLPALERAGIPHKDVTARERHLKLTINKLKCDLAGDSARYFVVERRKFVALSRVAAAAQALELAALAKDPAQAKAAKALAKELAALARAQPRRKASPRGGAGAAE